LGALGQRKRGESVLYVEAEILIKVKDIFTLLIHNNISLENLFLQVLGKIRFAKLRNSLPYNTLKTPPPWPPNQQEGRKVRGSLSKKVQLGFGGL